MFDSLLGGKFSNKCKHAVKCIKVRMVPIWNKKQAVLRFLRKDVADLIAAGHEANAFRRIDALIVEINRATCYDIIAQCCEIISTQLPTLQNHKECPQEAVEAVSTLIYAAARFPDLPELCVLRHVFAERYGSCMESFVNAEFVEKVGKKSFTREKKLQLMQDIAEEYSVRCDAKAFDHQTTSDAIRGKHGSNSASAVRGEQAETEAAADIHVISASLGTRQARVKPRRDHGGSCEADELECGVRGSPEKKGVVSVNGRHVEEYGRAGYLIPPYVKPKIHGDPVAAAGHDTNEGGEEAVLRGGEKPRPVSVRRKLRKPRVGETDDGENYVKEKSADGEGRRRPAYDEADHNAASGGQYEDEEEMVLDKLLLHYSRKGTAEEGSEGRRRVGAEHFGNGGKVHPLPRGAPPPPVPSESVNPATPGATSMRPDPVDANGGRVHPSLPDYDQLAARFAALKGT
ncbi:uncharacterized protein LOC103989415 [Musa acuminata AAA Group]|uniref:uncharacterized protein LOC103989415 n=1 Tax=Musa acuminata AAA Group TaxID=214697 RepID=UPI0031E3B4FA